MAFVGSFLQSRGEYERRRRAVCPPLPALPIPLQTTAQELASLPLGKRYAKLAEMSIDLQESFSLEEKYCTKEFRVRGCSSVVHVRAVVTEGGYVEVRGNSDAKLTSGLVVLLASSLSGCAPEEVQHFTFEEFASMAALSSFLAPSRANAFGNIVASIQDQLSDPAAGAGQDPSRSSWKAEMRPKQFLVEPQGADVAVLLSGGVDSSVSLRLLLAQGYRPKPFYLKIWLQDELAHLGACPWEEDIHYANAVCGQVGLEVEAVPLQKEYWDEVVSYTVREARAGRTPNPDVMCNSRVKFGVFLDRIGKDFPKVATGTEDKEGSGHFWTIVEAPDTKNRRMAAITTGHYATTRTNTDTGAVELFCSADEAKDQTYFLAHLKQQQVAKAMFPIGSYTKTRIRELASSFDLPNKLRRDSQGICFLGKLRFDEFLEHYLGKEPGPLVEYETGTELGSHRGFWFYTLGQRKGLGLSGGPWYVVSKRPRENIVYVSTKYHELDKPRDTFRVEDLLWISATPPTDEECKQLRVKVRHGPRYHECELHFDRDGSGEISCNSGLVNLQENEAVGLAPGQFAVFYHADRCLGSGVIAADPFLSSASPLTSIKTQKRLQAHYLP